jgi:hypothetical protein
MTPEQTRQTNNHIGPLMGDLDKIGTAKIVKEGIKKTIWDLARKLCSDMEAINESDGNK